MYGSVLFYFLLLYFRDTRANPQVDEAHDKSRWFFFTMENAVLSALSSCSKDCFTWSRFLIYFGEGDRLIVDGRRLSVTRILTDYGLALIEFPPSRVVEITELGSATELEQAEFINDFVLFGKGWLMPELHFLFWASSAVICRIRGIVVPLSCRQAR